MAFRKLLQRFERDEAGATAVEYALLIGLVAFLSVTAWDGIGTSLRRIFEMVTAAI